MSKEKYGLTLLGKVRVFRKDKEFKDEKTKKNFEITDVWFNVSEKEDNGEYVNKSVNLLFKKDLPLPENNTIIVLDAFPVLSGVGKYRKVAYMVMNWEQANE